MRCEDGPVLDAEISWVCSGRKREPKDGSQLSGLCQWVGGRAFH